MAIPQAQHIHVALTVVLGLCSSGETFEANLAEPPARTRAAYRELEACEEEEEEDPS